MRCASSTDRGRACGPVCEDQQSVIRRGVAVDADGVEGPRANIAQSFLQKRWRNSRISYDEREGRGQVGMNHPRALRASNHVDSLACHLERRAGGFRPRVRRAYGERELRKGTRRGTAVARELRQGAQNFFDGQRYANHARRADDDFIGSAAEALGCFRDRALSGGVARGARCAVRIAGIHNSGAHAALRRAQVFLGNGDRGGDYNILGENRGRGGWNVARNNGEIERAGFFQSAGDACEAKSVRERSLGECVLHQRDIRVTSAPPPEATSSPPKWRLRCLVELQFAGSWRSSYFAVFFKLRPSCKSAIAFRTTSVAVPPGTFLAASATCKLRLFAKSASNAGEIFIRSSKGSAVQTFPWRSASRSTVPTMSCA